MSPVMASEFLLYLMKNLPLDNVSNHWNFYQNTFINEYATNIKAKIPEVFSEV